jgi:hypothetical protein
MPSFFEKIGSVELSMYNKVRDYIKRWKPKPKAPKAVSPRSPNPQAQGFPSAIASMQALYETEPNRNGRSYRNARFDLSQDLQVIGQISHMVREGVRRAERTVTPLLAEPAPVNVQQRLVDQLSRDIAREIDVDIINRMTQPMFSGTTVTEFPSNFPISTYSTFRNDVGYGTTVAYNPFQVTHTGEPASMKAQGLDYLLPQAEVAKKLEESQLDAEGKLIKQPRHIEV